MNMEKLKLFVQLNKKMKEAEVELKEIKHRLDEMETGLVEEFIEDGVQNIKLDDRLVYLNIGVRASTDDDDALYELLTERTDFYGPRKINRNTLASWVHNLPRNNDTSEIEWPDEEIKELTKVQEVVSLRVKKA